MLFISCKYDDGCGTHISAEYICHLFTRHKNQVSVDAFLQQVLAPLSTIPRLQFKLSVQTVLSGLGNMHPPVSHTNLLKIKCMKDFDFSP